ncbi:MAG: FtsQ-type POTRA domain-containing protein [Lachnospiraceae bacterium]|nr:FtsQ-type POTRA domain-containing protein [Lachnospiraceae bacterium]
MSRIKKFVFITVAAVVVLLGVFIYLWKTYHISIVHVSGNKQYTQDEIRAMVLKGPLDSNSLFLRAERMIKKQTNIPFIERIDVRIDTPNEITIQVYEKAIAGCVSYLGRYMYFDKDGIIVESTSEKKDGIPEIKGLKFNACIMYEKLPIENDEIFQEILSITQMLDKYSIICDNIYFAGADSITLFFGDARVALGSMENIDEKMIKLQYIVPELKGMKGVLHMENYTEEDKDDYITFEKD